MATDGIVLSYYDSLLKKSDILLLDPPHWLNDKLIGFCFESVAIAHNVSMFFTSVVYNY